ncbi:MAG: sugar phosphate isomerase/epimerase [Candidatus Omnitrophota bacterium]|jgi:sugar phosphate isomerase/epimerase|nr:MAG: sugar phosphate isomerase/epimerase [Candidatus Omnitrophota bacterium]
MYLSISSYTWLPASFLGKLSLLHDYGIESVEIYSTKRHLDISDPEVVQQAGMAIRDMQFRGISLHAPSSVGDLSNPEESEREQTVLACQKTLDAAMLLGATMVTFHPASIEGDMSQGLERWISLSESLRDLSGYAEDRDLRVAVENLPEPFFGSNPLEMHDRISSLNLPNVGMCLDLGHAYAGGHLPSILSHFGETIFSVHASDNRGRVDDHLFPGRGYVPWEDIITGFRQMEFRGPFVLEVQDNRRIEQIIEDAIEFADKMGLQGVAQLSH